MSAATAGGAKQNLSRTRSSPAAAAEGGRLSLSLTVPAVQAIEPFPSGRGAGAGEPPGGLTFPSGPVSANPARKSRKSRRSRKEAKTGSSPGRVPFGKPAAAASRSVATARPASRQGPAPVALCRAHLHLQEVAFGHHLEPDLLGGGDDPGVPVVGQPLADKGGGQLVPDGGAEAEELFGQLALGDPSQRQALVGLHGSPRGEARSSHPAGSPARGWRRVGVW